jgi:hypothetical protein
VGVPWRAFFLLAVDSRQKYRGCLFAAQGFWLVRDLLACSIGQQRAKFGRRAEAMNSIEVALYGKYRQLHGRISKRASLTTVAICSNDSTPAMPSGNAVAVGGARGRSLMMEAGTL